MPLDSVMQDQIVVWCAIVLLVMVVLGALESQESGTASLA